MKDLTVVELAEIIGTTPMVLRGRMYQRTGEDSRYLKNGKIHIKPKAQKILMESFKDNPPKLRKTKLSRGKRSVVYIDDCPKCKTKLNVVEEKVTYCENCSSFYYKDKKAFYTRSGELKVI